MIYLPFDPSYCRFDSRRLHHQPSIRAKVLSHLPAPRPVRARVNKVDFVETSPLEALSTRVLAIVGSSCRPPSHARRLGRARQTGNLPPPGRPWLQRNHQDAAGYWIRRWEIHRLSQLQGPRFAAFSSPREQCFPFACLVNSLRMRTSSSARHLLNNTQGRMSGERIDEFQTGFRAEGTSCPALSQHAGSGALPGALPAHAREVAYDWPGTVLHQERSTMLVSPGGSRCLGGSRSAKIYIARSGGKCLSSWPVDSRASGL